MNIENGKIREVKEQLKRKRITTGMDIEDVENELAKKIVETDILKKNKKAKIEMELNRMKLENIQKENRKLKKFVEELKVKKRKNERGLLEKIKGLFNIIVLRSDR